MQRLWTPHRLSYVRGEGKAVGDEPEGCPFCRVIGLDDAEGLILARGELERKSLNVSAQGFSAKAREAIEAAGGTCTVVEHRPGRRPEGQRET